MTTPPLDFYEQFTSRNSGFIPDSAQRRIQNARVLVAGCGSTGGAAVEPLARLGIQDFVLADNGTYELNNLNRQHAGHRDVGRNKAEVNAEHVLAVNPFARVQVHPEGAQPDTVDDLVRGCDVVIDGIDVTERAGMLAKWALHESAARLRVPVVSGYDMAGMQYVRCYDYRLPSRPLNGAVTLRDIERSSSWQVLSRLIPKRKVPVEMLRDLRNSLNDNDYHVPQLVYTSMLFGAIASRITVELLRGESIRSAVSIDLHHSMRRRSVNGRLAAVKPVEILRTLRAVKKGLPA
jgi:hypothetical protein